MSSEMNALLVGFMLGIFGAFATLGLSGVGEYDNQAYYAIEECEKSLPRDQHCVVVISAEVTENE